MVSESKAQSASQTPLEELRKTAATTDDNSELRAEVTEFLHDAYQAANIHRTDAFVHVECSNPNYPKGPLAVHGTFAVLDDGTHSRNGTVTLHFPDAPGGPVVSEGIEVMAEDEFYGAIRDAPW